MTRPKTDLLKNVHVFIGSPSDLDKERRKFNDVINELNKNVAEEHGVHLKAVGWEDTLPGRGRPQELINEDLEPCDLIVMALWKRWGSPTNKYSSGFEEEFEISHAANKKIWLYFKDLPNDMLADPGDQLKKVLAFRDQIELGKEYLYRRFEDEADFEKQLRHDLSQWLQGFEPIKILPMSPAEPDPRVAELEYKVEEAQSKQEQIALDWANEAEDHASEGRLTKAEEYFARALAITNQPEAAHRYAIFLSRIGSLVKAEEIWTGIMERARQLDDREWESVALSNLGFIYKIQGDLDLAEEMHNQSLTLNKELGSKKGLAADYCYLGLIYKTRGDLDRAEQMHNQALILDKELGNKEGMAVDYSNLGVIYKIRGDLTEAEEMHNQSLTLNKELSRKEGMAINLGNLGVIYKIQGDLDLAEEMHNQSLTLNKELGSKEGMARDYNNLGLVYLMQGDLTKAEEMLNQSLTLNRVLGFKEGMANQYCNLGLIYGQRGDIERAEEMHNQSLTLNKELGSKAGMARDYDNLGLIYGERGDLSKAEEYVVKALQLSREIGAKLLIQQTENILELIREQMKKS